jgi:hypothetical protein
MKKLFLLICFSLLFTETATANFKKLSSDQYTKESYEFSGNVTDGFSIFIKEEYLKSVGVEAMANHYRLYWFQSNCKNHYFYMTNSFMTPNNKNAIFEEKESKKRINFNENTYHGKLIQKICKENI